MCRGVTDFGGCFRRTAARRLFVIQQNSATAMNPWRQGSTRSAGITASNSYCYAQARTGVYAHWLPEHPPGRAVDLLDDEQPAATQLQPGSR